MLHALANVLCTVPSKFATGTRYPTRFAISIMAADGDAPWLERCCRRTPSVHSILGIGGCITAV